MRKGGPPAEFDVVGAIPGLGNAVSVGATVAGTAYGIATVGNDPVAAISAALGGAIPIVNMFLVCLPECGPVKSLA